MYLPIPHPLFRLLLGGAVLACLAHGAWAETLYVAPGGRGNGGSPASPLGNIPEAYRHASEGDIIELADGEYDAQPNLGQREDTEEWTRNVIVRPAPGAKAVLGTKQWLIYARRLTLSGLHLKVRVVVRHGADYFRMENCVSRLDPGQVASVTLSADHCQVAKNLFEGASGDAAAIVISPGGGKQLTSDILVEDNVIRDYVSQPEGADEDGIQINGCENIVIRRNRITNVGHSCIVASGGLGSKMSPNLLIENNFLARGNSQSRAMTLDVRSAKSIVVVRNNTILGSVAATSSEGSKLYNNIIAFLNNRSASEEYNLVFECKQGGGLTIGETSREGALPAFAEEDGADCHLAKGTSEPLDFGTPDGAPQDDIDGQPRSSTRVWVGADDPTIPPPPAPQS